MLARISTFRTSPFISISRRHASTRTLGKNNKAIVGQLKSEILEEKKHSNPNRYRIKSLQNAVDTITKLDFDITSPDAVKNIDGIGLGVTKRIREYFAPESPQAGKSDVALVEELESIPGIGRKRAEKLVEAGCHSQADLQQERFMNMLSTGARMSVRYKEHLERHATREQTETVTEFIRGSLSPKYDVVTVGDYRRGASESTSIDIVLFHPEHVHVPTPPLPRRGEKVPLGKAATSPRLKAEAPIQKLVVPILQERGLLVDMLHSGLRHYDGLARVPEKDEEGRWRSRRERLIAIKEGTGEYRRLHIHLMPVKSRGAALLYYTGDVAMRNLLKRKARNLDLYLDELGLWRWHADEAESQLPGDKAVGFWQLLNSTTEEAIFEQLGIDYVEPKRRNLARLH
ncbi:hypothetical protein FPV67DRAFT_1479898 [Lyophyllum atratum]|nr:hypothetical protein FPV67DRAFT_1479898 [Lyophyllum atratum]